jgi:recombination protein RecA
MNKAKELMQEINSLLGTNVVTMANDKRLEIEYIPTGVLPIDHLLGGGIPRGRVTELFGAYSTLKSYITLSTIAQAQKQGIVCALVDTEHSFEPDWSSDIGIDNDSLIYQTPETGEEAIDTIESLIRVGVGLIVWDSIAASLPQAEGNKRMSKESMQPARLAALMSAGMRKITAANRDTALLFVNQTRMNVGVMFGDPEVVAGGKALPYYASYRVALRKAGKVKDTVEGYDAEGKKTKVNSTIGINIRATLEKSKLSSPMQEVIFQWNLMQGAVDEVGYLISFGLLQGIIKHEGKSWWINEDEKIVGTEKFRGWLTENPQVQEAIRQKIPLTNGRSEPDKKKVGKLKKK